MLRRSSVVPALVGLLLTAPSALAQEPGVHVDPGSPAGKEYALPIERARSQASGQLQPVGPSQSGNDSVLFGSGVTKPRPKRQPARRKSKGKSTLTLRATPPKATNQQVQAALTAGSATGGTAGILGAVLGAAALVGVLARRRARPDTD